jgi:hypothetical protein
MAAQARFVVLVQATVCRSPSAQVEHSVHEAVPPPEKVPGLQALQVALVALVPPVQPKPGSQLRHGAQAFVPSDQVPTVFAQGVQEASAEALPAAYPSPGWQLRQAVHSIVPPVENVLPLQATHWLLDVGVPGTKPEPALQVDQAWQVAVPPSDHWPSGHGVQEASTVALPTA